MCISSCETLNFKILQPEILFGGIQHFSISTMDLERDAVDDSHQINTKIRSIEWRKVNVESRSRKSDLSKIILSNIDGYAKAGMVAQSS